MGNPRSLVGRVLDYLHQPNRWHPQALPPAVAQPRPRRPETGDIAMTADQRRVAAYGICLRDQRVLLARYVSPDGAARHWTLPGGRVELGEDPFTAVVREVAEETGYDVAVERLLGVDSRPQRVEWEGTVMFQAIGIYYRVRVTGGHLRNEVGGSTDLASWVSLSEVPDLERAVIVDVGLQLHRTQPPTGHVPPIPVQGLLRH